MFQHDFSDLDKDGSGALDEEEIVVLLSQQLGTTPSPSQVKSLMGALDRDANGKIGLHEYLNYVCGPGWRVEGQQTVEPTEQDGILLTRSQYGSQPSMRREPPVRSLIWC